MTGHRTHCGIPPPRSPIVEGFLSTCKRVSRRLRQAAALQFQIHGRNDFDVSKMTKSHWEQVYDTKAHDAVSWYAPHLSESLSYIRRTGVRADAEVIDVGGGEATLVDDLLEAGFRRVSVLDISNNALTVCRERLGQRAGWSARPDRFRSPS